MYSGVWEVSEALGELLQPMPEKITMGGLNRSSGGCWDKAYPLSGLSALWLLTTDCVTPGSMGLPWLSLLSPVGCSPLIPFTHQEILSKSIEWWLRAIICLLCWKEYKAIWRKPFTIGLKKSPVYLEVMSLLTWKIKAKLQSFHNIGLFWLQSVLFLKKIP